MYGQSLTENTIKEFEVIEAYRHRLSVNGIEIGKPKSNSLDPLTVAFDRVMDHALAESMIQIRDEEKNRVAGHWEILEQERLFQFIPEGRWQRGNYQIVIDSRLEDSAGNNLQNLLDQNGSDAENNTDPHQIIDFKI